MKILGISFGRKMERCEIMTKEALFKAKEAYPEAEVKFISTINMNIGHCKGCGACGNFLDKTGKVKCVIKDDYSVLEEALLDADAIILAAPVYAVGIVGQFKNFLDRFGAAHDRASLLEAKKNHEAEGKIAIDKRYFKPRYIGYISVGGASTHNWVSFGLPMLHLFDFSNHMKAVGHVDAYDQGRTGSPLLNTELMAKCGELGKAVADSVGKPYSEVKWFGEEGTCPVCHCNFIELNNDKSTRVECPICGIYGDVSVEDNKIKITFSEEQQNRARSTMAGLYEHFNEIRGFGAICGPKLDAAKDELPKMLEKYKNFDEIINA